MPRGPELQVSSIRLLLHCVYAAAHAAQGVHPHTLGSDRVSPSLSRAASAVSLRIAAWKTKLLSMKMGLAVGLSGSVHEREESRAGSCFHEMRTLIRLMGNSDKNGSSNGEMGDARVMQA